MVDLAALEALRGALRGEAITPDDEAYASARTIWNGTIDRQPALIVRCRGVADVVDAVQFARTAGLPVSVRGGGHHVAGGSLNDGGVVVDLSLMRGVRVDPVAQTVRAEGGAQIGDLDRETQAFGLAVPMGLVSKTGIGGLTLAGGFGWMRREHGLSCDNLIGADVVTADGRLLHANATEHADLFWALRGGGWDLGVVTSFEFRAHALGPDVMVAFVTYPMSEAAQVLRGFHEWGRSAPEACSPVAVFWTFPEAEMFPPQLWGQQFVALAGPYTGALSEGEAAIAPLRALATPLLDMSGPMPYTAVQRMFDDDYPDGRRYYWKSTYLKTLDGTAIDTLVALGASRPSPLTSLDVWLLGGAIKGVRDAESAVAHRDAEYLIGIESNWDDAGADATNIAWARNAERALAAFSTGGSYLNFEDLSETGVLSASHAGNFDRLVAVKQQYDPADLFRSRRAR